LKRETSATLNNLRAFQDLKIQGAHKTQENRAATPGGRDETADNPATGRKGVSPSESSSDKFEVP
jgi:hypothetical protein